MNGKPKSYGAMEKAVAFAKCPWSPPLSRKQQFAWSAYKNILKVIMIYADQTTGAHAFVSNGMLMEGTGLSERFIRDALPDMENLRLITCTGNRKGGRAGRNGKGIAPEWRIELRNALFPDQTPTGEWLIVGGTDPETVGGSNGHSRGHQEAMKGAPNHDVGGTNGVSRGHISATLSGALSEPPPPPPPPPSGAPETGAMAGEEEGDSSSQDEDAEESYEEFIQVGRERVARLLASVTKLPKIIPPKQKAELERKAASMPSFEHLTGMLSTWITEKEKTDLGLNGLKHPWLHFLRAWPQVFDLYAKRLAEKETARR